jgi:hypothetical protein
MQCQIKLIYDVAASLYNVSAMYDVLLISIGQNMMTKSKNVLANKPRVIINNSMSTNRAAKCHNVADISKE